MSHACNEPSSTPKEKLLNTKFSLCFLSLLTRLLHKVILIFFWSEKNGNAKNDGDGKMENVEKSKVFWFQTQMLETLRIFFLTRNLLSFKISLLAVLMSLVCAHSSIKIIILFMQLHTKKNTAKNDSFVYNRVAPVDSTAAQWNRM